ncbi:AAA family ATPase [Microbacterium sp. EYE_5]|uniref:AAA family ATPase n=1 Tax=unclassified Microbacterium TaxID=2609290 RepID=UPI002006320F|nr:MULTISPECIES: AAA family ATPase [unclassified Microbacterium]MCK6080620.1 AAA family ATPase [Microbacterium sp. EYE_382]MCK6085891.1 AAA family ATPase [Microbacterium sp. EYE_384]MCK6124611.1 AAA family ATPase [Microbacterium sp. EYE_80]MCK6127520.1 AAA family ATPase [Microbacterium sp. EYE_79]MCK6141575.1 AAA family ATPase [Microbacterium sp. EYE_39]
MLSADDPLGFSPHRVVVAGTTGVGKTTLARRLARLWDLEHTELDSLFHGPGWTPRPEFLDDVRRVASGERWVSEWNYFGAGGGQLLGERADLAVWLDLPRRVARTRLLRRTVRRRIRREPLWNGNTEPPLWTVFRDPDHILRWEMRTHGTWRERMPRVSADYDLPVVRLTRARDVDRWLAGPAAEVAP